MKLSGTASLNASPQEVWEAVHDPAVLARCLPGCQQLTVVGTHEYAMTVTAGVSAIKGTYDGRVTLSRQQHPESFVMTAVGAGAPGTVNADVLVRLAPSHSGGTDLAYEADAAVGGAIGGVGQRMLVGVTRRMAGDFFAAVDEEVAGTRGSAESPPSPDGTPPAPGTGPATAEIPVAPARGSEPGETTMPAVYPGRAAVPGLEPSRARDVALGVAVGGLVALAGVIVGWAIGGR